MKGVLICSICEKAYVPKEGHKGDICHRCLSRAKRRKKKVGNWGTMR